MAMEQTAEVVNAAYEALYSHYAGLTAEVLEREIVELMDANDYPHGGGAVVVLYLIPQAGGAIRMLSCERQLAWDRHAHTTGVRALVVPYDLSFAAYRTAAALAAHGCAQAYARRSGYDAAVGQGASGALWGVGDAPLFAATGERVVVATAGDGVERRSGIAACRKAGLEVYEGAVMGEELGGFDEIFAITPQGVTSVGEIDGRVLPHSLARMVLKYLAD